MEKKPLNVAINGRFLTQNVTGVQRFSIEIVKCLDSLSANNQNVNFTLLYPENAELKTKLQLDHITILPFGTNGGHLWEQLQLPKFKCDKLVCLGNTAPVISLLKNKVYTVVHDLSFRYFPDSYSLPFRLWYHFIIPLVMKFSHNKYTVSNSEKAAITAIYPKNGPLLEVIPCGGFSSEIKASFDKVKEEKRENIFLYVGSLNPRKNLIGVLEAYSQLKIKEEFKVHVVGGGADVFGNYELKKFLDDKNIIFHGHINDPLKIVALYKKAFAFVFPSFYEASPIPPIEAMNCGLPVIASNIPSLLERCDDAASFCQADDISSITNAMSKLSEDKEYYDQQVKKGLERSEYFSWEKSATKLYSDLMTEDG